VIDVLDGDPVAKIIVFTITFRVDAALLPHPLLAFTEIVPAPPESNLIFTLVVPCPLKIYHPEPVTDHI